MLLQTAVNLIYPPQCVLCDEMVEDAHALCGACWLETPFIMGLACDTCGVPLPGQSKQAEQCDDCMGLARPWRRGRAAICYSDLGRKLVLALKHGDRQDLVRPAALWMMKAALDLLPKTDVLVPIPLHWTRLVRRRYNQSALLAHRIGREADVSVIPDALHRHIRTPVQDGKSVAARFANMKDVFEVAPKRKDQIVGKRVLLVDDVMTSGATFAAAAEVCYTAGASTVSVLALARVTKDNRG